MASGGSLPHVGHCGMKQKRLHFFIVLSKVKLLHFRGFLKQKLNHNLLTGLNWLMTPNTNNELLYLT